MAGSLVLWSGGVDSTTLLFETCEELHSRGVDAEDAQAFGLFVDYGHLGCGLEQRAIGASVGQLGRRYPHIFGGFLTRRADLPNHAMTAQAAVARRYAPGYPHGMVPARNTVFAALGYFEARQRGLGRVLIATHGPPPGTVYDGYSRARFPDCSPAWVNAMRAIYQLENATCAAREPPVTLDAPYIDRDKREIVRRARELGVPVEVTTACYFPIFGDDEDGGTRPCGVCDGCLARKAAGLEA